MKNIKNLTSTNTNKNFGKEIPKNKNSESLENENQRNTVKVDSSTKQKYENLMKKEDLIFHNRDQDYFDQNSIKHYIRTEENENSKNKNAFKVILFKCNF